MFGTCQPIQIAKDAKFRKLTVTKECSEQKVKYVAQQLFDRGLERSEGQTVSQLHRRLFKEIRHVTHGFPSAIKTEARNRDGLYKKGL